MAKKSGNKAVRFFKNSIRVTLQVITVAMQWAFLLIVLYRVVPVPLTPLHIARLFDQTEEGKPLRLTKDWTSIEHLGQPICKAVLAAEDGRFFEHFGFDFEQMQKAIENSLEKGRKLRGASTITQQTAKNLFFTPQRSWIRKVPEMGITVLLEVLWTKRRILEVYLNIIETGEGIYGMQAAAIEYFDKPCDKLSKRECALIASCLPNPRTRKPDKPTKFINRKAARVQRGMKKIELVGWE
jgi:monofunctional biosynthetic peptidoglycan transglycosylase